jgi:hypothetical protein
LMSLFDHCHLPASAAGFSAGAGDVRLAPAFWPRNAVLIRCDGISRASNSEEFSCSDSLCARLKPSEPRGYIAQGPQRTLLHANVQSSSRVSLCDCRRAIFNPWT